MSARNNPEVDRHALNTAWEQAVATLLTDPQQRSLARDCYFDGTAVEAGARYWASEEWRTASSLLPEVQGEALDVGAGRGIVSYALARDGWKVCALEPDGSALVGADAIRGLAAATGFPIDVFEAFGEALPFENEQFDLIIARQSLHHARDLRALMRELYRVSRPGGRLIALRDHVISSAGDLARFHEVHPLHRLYGGEHAYLLKEYTSAIRSAGFSLQKVIAPLESPINFAPLTRETLATEIANRLPNFFGARRSARRLLSTPAIMTIALKLMRRIDNRPGRLYSFVADRQGT
jgi:SAM-dependent methyltransferase